MSIYAENRSKTIGAIATLLYILMWVLLILFISFNSSLPKTEEGEGILINFGDSETGLGNEDLNNNLDPADASVASNSAVSPDDEFVNQDHEEAPKVPKPAAKPKPATTPPVAKPQQVNKRALFPGKSSSTATSEGTAGGAGNQGNLAGSPDGSHTGTGLGTSGNSYNLNGRSLRESLPNPVYTVNDDGRIIIEIRVNPQGEVVSASFRSVGSTSTNSQLVAAAEKAAKKAKFNVDENAPFPQMGTIIYNFKRK